MSDQPSTELFDPAENSPEPARPPDWMNVVARKKLGQPDTWRYCRAEWIGDTDALIEGGITRALKSGPRKGLPTWRDSVMTKCVVTAAELEQARLDYEAETGKCSNCAGSGQWWLGWAYDTGNQYEPCKRCKATGKASEITQ